jgi:arthrofactin-type cyclic lipopeptide synthetase B
MAQPEGHKDPAYLAKIIQWENITTLHFVPSMLRTFLAHDEATKCDGVARVICSGETLPTVPMQVCEICPRGLHNL